MPDYDLRGLSPRSFEQMVVVLASKLFGPGAITPFGDGRDGGREATFQGQTSYVTNADPWDGYGVLQAKFLQRPRDSTFDGDWALSQLDKELSVFEAPSSPRKIPEYYIFVTNVVLTPVAEVGSKDRVLKRMGDFAQAKNLKGYDVWDYDKIRMLLDGDVDVRSAFRAWITTGDVIHQLVEQLQEPNLHLHLVRLLQKQFLEDQYARLEQAGFAADQRIPLANVFIDVPVDSSPPVSEREETGPDGPKPPGFVEIFGASGQRLLSLRHDGPVDAHEFRRAPKGSGRFVLIGGPGQGKTTVGQFICQLFRAAILQGVESNQLTEEVKQELESLSLQGEELGFSVPATKRFPIRIVLSAFAEAWRTIPRTLFLGS